MEFEYDTEKDAINRAKHGVSLVLGAVVLENRVGEIVDDRRDYGEVRINAFGFIGNRLFVCTYTNPRNLRLSELLESPESRFGGWHEMPAWERIDGPADRGHPDGRLCGGAARPGGKSG